MPLLIRIWLRAIGLALCLMACIVVHASPGDLDPNFGTAGKVRFGFGGGADGARWLAIQADGKIIVAGSRSSLSIFESDVGVVMRLQQDGTPDIDFGKSGKVLVPLNSVSAVTIDTSGHIVIVGTTRSLVGNVDLATVRLNSNGSLDASFGNSGKSVIPNRSRFFSVVSSMALQADGKIVLAGHGAVGTVSGFVAARLNQDGSIDQGFGNNGVIAVAVNGGGAHGVVIDASGRIVMSGSYLVGSYSNFAIVRLTNNGMPDTAFGLGGNGVVTIPVNGGDGLANVVTIDSSGRIVAAGYAIAASWDFATIRLNDDGTLDDNFGIEGISIITGHGVSMIDAIAIDMNGKLWLSGNQNMNSTTPPNPVLIRLNSNGTGDMDFGSKGKIITLEYKEAMAIGVDASSRLMVAGVDGVGSNRDIAVLRFNYDGSLDASFGSKGEVRIDAGNGQSEAQALIRQPDGKFLVAGYTLKSSWHFAVARLNPDGSDDLSFGTNGRTTFTSHHGNYPLSSYAYGMSTTSTGQILLAGGTADPYENNRTISVGRLNPNGMLDKSFGNNGITYISIGIDSRAYAVAEDATGGIIVAGSTGASPWGGYTIGSSIVVARLLSDGTLDTSFGTAGKTVIPILGDSLGPNSLAIDSAGKIIVVGTTGLYDSSGLFGVARLRPDGMLDTTFGTGGRLAISVGSGSGNPRAVKIDASGNLLIAGSTGTSVSLAVVRLKPDGTKDASFGNNGIATFSFEGNYNDNISALSIDVKERILVAGSAKTTGSAYQHIAIARLLPDGMLDISFGAKGKILATIGGDNSIACSMVVQPNDGKIVVAGNGSYNFGLMRIEGDPLNTLNLAAGWNLVGNGADAQIDVAATLGDASKVSTVWKWIPATRKWAFYTPTLPDGGAAYAENKGYSSLTDIDSGEGFWVNLKMPIAFTLPSNNLLSAATFQTTLTRGWNLISIGESKTPSQFNLALNQMQAVAGATPSNFSAIWAWDNAQSKWYFYATGLEAQGDTTLADYIASKGYLDFTATNKMLGPGVGFWVNKPSE